MNVLKTVTDTTMRTCIFIIVFLVAMNLVVGQTKKTTKQTDKRTTTTAVAKTQPHQYNAGYRVYLDPKTGKIVSAPPAGTEPLTLSPELQNALSTSGEDLKTVPAPGGGIMVDLQGRFHDAMTASVSPDGKVQIPCVGDAKKLQPTKKVTPSKERSKKQ